MRKTSALLVLAIGSLLPGSADAQFTVGIDPPGYVPGYSRDGYLAPSNFGYGAYGRRGFGYYTGLPDIGYYSGGPSAAYSPIFNAPTAAPRRPSMAYGSAYAPPGGVSPLPSGPAVPPHWSPRERRGVLGRLFSR